MSERGSLDDVALLVVDDDALVRELFHRLFARLRIDGAVVASGDAACEVARHRQFSLVLIDHGLAGEEGRDVAQRLRPLVGSGTRLIRVSGASDGPGPARDGFDGVDEKPSSAASLRDAIARWR